MAGAPVQSRIFYAAMGSLQHIQCLCQHRSQNSSSSLRGGGRAKPLVHGAAKIPGLGLILRLPAEGGGSLMAKLNREQRDASGPARPVDEQHAQPR